MLKRMPRRKLELSPDRFYHVYNRGVGRRRIFFSRANRVFFLRRLRDYCEPNSEGGTSIVAYCLMPNHFHLLVRPYAADLAVRIGRLCKSYTQAINRERERVGPLFQGRFKAVLVDEESQLVHLSRYIHLNPVAAGLVPRPGGWEFSSYRDFIGSRPGTLPDPDPIFRCFEGGDPRARYRHFVEAGVVSDDPLVDGLTLEHD